MDSQIIRFALCGNGSGLRIPLDRSARVGEFSNEAKAIEPSPNEARLSSERRERRSESEQLKFMEDPIVLELENFTYLWRSEREPSPLPKCE